ncbi:hypothetical protein FACS1894158_17940 [Betaproteobacteria bacterium]|nr:hypothetical protein FACS1894158_17940 [Betaproteobacteria bacterium]
MNARIACASVFGLILSACGFPVPIFESDFEWRYPVLSKSDCPDIAGVYLND